MAKWLSTVLLLVLSAGFGGAIGGVVAGVIIDPGHALDLSIWGAVIGAAGGMWIDLILLFFKPRVGLFYFAAVSFSGGFLTGLAVFLLLRGWEILVDLFRH